MTTQEKILEQQEADRHQAQIEDRYVIDNKKFDIRAIVLAFGAGPDIRYWTTFKRIIDYVENFAIGGLITLHEEHLIEILKDLEEEDLVNVNWDQETYTTNY